MDTDPVNSGKYIPPIIKEKVQVSERTSTEDKTYSVGRRTLEEQGPVGKLKSLLGRVTSTLSSSLMFLVRAVWSVVVKVWSLLPPHLSDEDFKELLEKAKYGKPIIIEDNKGNKRKVTREKMFEDFGPFLTKSQKQFKETMENANSLFSVSKEVEEDLFKLFKDDKSFRKDFSEFIKQIKGLQKQTLDSLVNEDKLPDNFEKLREDLDNAVTQFSLYQNRLLPEVIESLMKMEEIALVRFTQQLTESFPLGGYNPPSDADANDQLTKDLPGYTSRLIEVGRKYREETELFGEFPGDIFVPGFGPNNWLTSETHRYFTRVNWEDPEEENGISSKRVCHFASGKYRTKGEEPKWESVKEIDIEFDLSSLQLKSGDPENNDKKIKNFFSVLFKITDDQAIEDLQELFPNSDPQVVGKSLQEHNEKVQLAVSKVRYAINFPDAKIPDVKTIYP